MRGKERATQFIRAFRDWANDTPLRIRGLLTSLIALIASGFVVANWLQQHVPPWYVWFSFGIAICGIIWISFLPYYKRIKNKSVKITVLSAYQPNIPPNKKDHINIDVEFNLKTIVLPIKISKIQLLTGTEFLEANTLVPIDQVIELESYVANFDLGYYLYLSNVMADGQGEFRLCVIAAGYKWISNKFSLGNPSTLLMRNKPDDFNLVIK